MDIFQFAKWYPLTHQKVVPLQPTPKNLSGWEPLHGVSDDHGILARVLRGEILIALLSGDVWAKILDRRSN